MIVIDICLSDIPADARVTAQNGKIYCKFVVDTKREADKMGNTHCAYINQTKEQREAKVDKVYVGNGKEFLFNGQQAAKPQPATAPAAPPKVNLGF